MFQPGLLAMVYGVSRGLQAAQGGAIGSEKEKRLG